MTQISNYINTNRLKKRVESLSKVVFALLLFFQAGFELEKIDNIDKISFSFTTKAYAEELSDKDYLSRFFSEPFSPEEARQQSDGVCESRCRLLNLDPELRLYEKFVTKIVDFDAATGVTTCDVFPANAKSNEESKLSIMANHKDIDCVNIYTKELKPNYNDPSLASFKKMDQRNDTYVTLGDQNNATTQYNRNRLTVSKFIAGLATLDQDIIDLSSTVGTGMITRTDGQDIYTTGRIKPEDVSKAPKNAQEVGQGQSVQGANGTIINIPDRLYNAMDKLSRENLGYFVDLSYEMDKVYDYIISYIFVFISLFFMALYFAKVAIKKISKKSTSYDESWQNKLAVVIIAIVVFFIPIRFDENYSATFFQNTWKFFVDESTSIADRANIVGMRTLMKNTFNTTGASGVQNEANLLSLKKKQFHLVVHYSDLLSDCRKKYPYEITFQETKVGYINRIEEQFGKNIVNSEGDRKDIIYKGCRAIEARYKIANTALEQYTHMLNRIALAYNDNAEIIARLQEIDSFMSAKVLELGWYSSVLAPTLKILVDSAYIQSTMPPVDIDEEAEINGYEAKVNEATDTRIANKEDEAKGGNNFANQFNSNKDFQKDVGDIFGNLAYSLIPGYKSVSDFITKTFESNDLKEIMKSVPPEDNLKLYNVSDNKVNDKVLATHITKYYTKLMPFALAFIASAIVIILYIYELIVFTFVSPFIVAFALTTGQARKIIDFLVTALMIFLKPVIITIGIYLALFLYQAFGDIFVMLADEQYYLSAMTSDSFWSTLTFSFLKELSKVFATFASIYILWKVIMHISDFIFKLIGLDKITTTTDFANSMQQSFGRYGFRA